MKKKKDILNDPDSILFDDDTDYPESTGSGGENKEDIPILSKATKTKYVQTVKSPKKIFTYTSNTINPKKIVSKAIPEEKKLAKTRLIQCTKCGSYVYVNTNSKEAYCPNSHLLYRDSSQDTIKSTRLTKKQKKKSYGGWFGSNDLTKDYGAGNPSSTGGRGWKNHKW